MNDESGSVETCKWCSDGYFLENNICNLINSSVVVVNTNNAYEILSKTSAGIEIIIYNNQPKLMRTCENTNGFSCICSSSSLTSVCGTFKYEINVSSLFSSAITCSEFIKFSNILRMAR